MDMKCGASHAAIIYMSSGSKLTTTVISSALLSMVPATTPHNHCPSRLELSVWRGAEDGDGYELGASQ